MTVSVSISRTSLLDEPGFIPHIIHHAHDAGVPCGWCDAPLDARPKRGEFPEPAQEART